MNGLQTCPKPCSAAILDLSAIPRVLDSGIVAIQLDGRMFPAANGYNNPGANTNVRLLGRFSAKDSRAMPPSVIVSSFCDIFLFVSEDSRRIFVLPIAVRARLSHIRTDSIENHSQLSLLEQCQVVLMMRSGVIQGFKAFTS